MKRTRSRRTRRNNRTRRNRRRMIVRGGELIKSTYNTWRITGSTEYKGYKSIDVMYDGQTTLLIRPADSRSEIDRITLDDTRNVKLSKMNGIIDERIKQELNKINEKMNPPR